MLQELRKSPGPGFGRAGPSDPCYTPRRLLGVCFSDKRRVDGWRSLGLTLLLSSLSLCLPRAPLLCHLPLLLLLCPSGQFPAFLPEEGEGNFSLEPDGGERGGRLDGRWPEPSL